jgi:hypothetical protein
LLVFQRVTVERTFYSLLSLIPGMGSSKPIQQSFASTSLLVVAFFAGQWLGPEVAKPLDFVPHEVTLEDILELPSVREGRRFDRSNPEQHGDVVLSHQDVDIDPVQGSGWCFSKLGESYNSSIHVVDEEVAAIDAIGDAQLPLPSSFDVFEQLGARTVGWAASDSVLVVIIWAFSFFGLIVSRSDIADMRREEAEDIDFGFDSYQGWLSLQSQSFLVYSVTAMFSVFAMIGGSALCDHDLPYLLRHGCLLEEVFTVEWLWKMQDNIVFGVMVIVVVLGVIVAHTDVIEMAEEKSEEIIVNDSCEPSSRLCAASVFAFLLFSAISLSIANAHTSFWSFWDLVLNPFWLICSCLDYQVNDTISCVVLATYTVLGVLFAIVDIDEMRKEDVDPRDGSIPIQEAS